MAANPTPQLQQPHAVSPAESIIAVCHRHQLSCGTPADLSAFLQALDTNKLLAMDFWSVVARAEAAPGSGTNSDHLLATIVSAVTGGTIADAIAAAPETASLIHKLTRVLAGEDVENPLANTPFPPSRQLDLSMLQSRGLKMATARKVVAISLRNSATLPFPASSAAPDVPSASPAPSTSAFASLARYADSQSRKFSAAKMLGAALVLVFAASSSWRLMHHHSVPPWKSLDASAHTTSKLPSASIDPTHTAPIASRQAPASTQSPLAATSVPAHPSISKPTTPQAAKPVPTASAPQQSASIAAIKPITTKLPDGNSLEANASSSVLQPPAATGPIAVPESQMQRLLASSRVPIYPESARASHLQGLVTIQAVVNKDGSVGHLRVLSGDPALQHAALDSVATWHYRPFLVNNQPVAVLTTVSVDFSETE